MLYKSKLHCPKVGVTAQTKIKIVHLPDWEVQGEERERDAHAYGPKVYMEWSVIIHFSCSEQVRSTKSTSYEQ